MSIKILVVDDEPDLESLVRQKFRQKIRGGEFEFQFALNGLEALDKLKADPTIEVVMSDINMPVMDGLTLLGHVSDLGNRTLKTVIVSAYGDMQNIRTAMNRGAYDFLTKPIDFGDFETTIRKTSQEIETIRQGLRAREELSALQQELSVAARIQQSILPRTFPPFPNRQDFELYAEMIPARHVGGDFYDFFLIDNNRLGFVIGDVSGKGIPAAIFMAVSRTLLRATALQGGTAGECVQYVNRILARQSEASTFVTIFYCILHTATGELEYAIGGHNPAYVVAPGEPVTAINDPGGFMVGAFDSAQYDTGHITLKPGATVVLYTDGVSEASNIAEEEYSPERLEACLASNTEQSAEGLVRQVISEVRAFTAGAVQSDDLTMLALKYMG
jgi:sigma-B regulation protein RsbU (phosphoserine phosphatase)